jgi:hypothetical protein
MGAGRRAAKAIRECFISKDQVGPNNSMFAKNQQLKVVEK